MPTNNTNVKAAIYLGISILSSPARLKFFSPETRLPSLDRIPYVIEKKLTEKAENANEYIGEGGKSDFKYIICLFLFFIAFPRPSFDLFERSTQPSSFPLNFFSFTLQSNQLILLRLI